MIHGTYAGAAASLWADNDFYRRDITQEIRIQSDYQDAPLNWMVGGYYQNARMKNDIVIGWNLALNPAIIALTDIYTFSSQVWARAFRLSWTGDPRR